LLLVDPDPNPDPNPDADADTDDADDTDADKCGSRICERVVSGVDMAGVLVGSGVNCLVKAGGEYDASSTVGESTPNGGGTLLDCCFESNVSGVVVVIVVVVVGFSFPVTAAVFGLDVALTRCRGGDGCGCGCGCGGRGGDDDDGSDLVNETVSNGASSPPVTTTGTSVAMDDMELLDT
jgi:hypothetical protein